MNKMSETGPEDLVTTGLDEEEVQARLGGDRTDAQTRQVEKLSADIQARESGAPTMSSRFESEGTLTSEQAQQRQADEWAKKIADAEAAEKAAR